MTLSFMTIGFGLLASFLNQVRAEDECCACSIDSGNKRWSGIDITVVGPPWMPSYDASAPDGVPSFPFGGPYMNWLNSGPCAQHPNSSVWGACMDVGAEFEQLTGAKVRFHKLSYGGQFQAKVDDVLVNGFKTADVFMFYPGNQYVTHRHLGYYQDITSLVERSGWTEDLEWDDIFPTLRSQATINGSIWILPVDGNALHMVYYKDLLPAGGAPQTWEELLEWTMQHYGKPVGERGRFGGCFYTGPHPESFFFTLMASYMQGAAKSDAGKVGIWFDPQDLSILFNNEAGKYVLNLYKEFVKYSAHTITTADKQPPGAVQFFDMIDWTISKDACLWSMSYPGNVKDLFQGYNDPLSGGKYKDELTVSAVPGSKRILDRAAGQLVKCSESLCPFAKMGRDGDLINYAPYFGAGGGETIGMRKIQENEADWERKRDATFDFMTFMASKRISTEGVLQTPLDPFRYSHVQGITDPSDHVHQLHLKVGWRASQLQAWMNSCNDALSAPNFGLDLGINGNTLYKEKLGLHLISLRGDDNNTAATPEQFLTDLKKDWDDVKTSYATGQDGLLGYLNEYRAFFSLPQLAALECDSPGTGLDGGATCVLCDPGKFALDGRCARCPEGFINDAYGATKCEPCDAGAYANLSGGVTCLPCPPGAYSQVGSATCMPCAPGTVTSFIGSVECGSCPAGTFQDEKGQTDCVQCPGMMSTLTDGRVRVADCVCKADYFGPRATSLESSCNSCPPLQQSPLGSLSASECTLSAAGGAIIAAAILLVVGSICTCFIVRTVKKRYAARLEALLEQKLLDGLRCVKALDFPMVLTSASSFLRLDLSTARTLHEGCRNRGLLIFLDTVEIIHHFKSQSHKILFFSYQWASWDQSGPNETQWPCMQQAIDQVVGMSSVSIGNLYIWLDILCIPQFNDSIKALAVNSLYTFSQLADIMLVVAPTTTHNNLQTQCNVETYKRRVWCRVEQFAFFCFHGVASMLVTVVPGVVDRCPDGWMHSVGHIFDGDMTCCAKKHASANSCDKESLVKPLLALYFDLYTKMKNGKLDKQAQGAWDFIADQLERVFPANFDYVTETNQSIDKVAKKILFGDMIARVTRYVDNDLSKACEMVSDMPSGKGTKYAVLAHDNRDQMRNSCSSKSPREFFEQERTSAPQHNGSILYV